MIKQEKRKFILRFSCLMDRTENDYLAETEFVHYLKENGASVADVLLSKNGKMVEKIVENDRMYYASLFEYAEGIQIAENGYRYRKNTPLSEYFFNTGKTLGKIHALSKRYQPTWRRPDYFEKYNKEYIDFLIPDSYFRLKEAIFQRLEKFEKMKRDNNNYGLVHFDFSDGNYHIDMNDGTITVFDFDNCLYCWYMFDLANLWTHGVGWCQFMEHAKDRKDYMEDYFRTILLGYREETEVDKSDLENLPLFIDIVLIENIVDEFECCQRNRKELDWEDISDVSFALINNVQYAGFLE